MHPRPLRATLLACAAAALVVLVTSAPSARAQAPATGPLVVKVGLLLLSVGKLDVASGSYNADFYLSLKSDRDMGDPRMELMNGRAASFEKIIDTPTEKQFRVNANLLTNMDIRRFPWDAHDLPIIFESFSRNDTDLVFVPNPQQVGVDPAVVFVGWALKGVSADVTTHGYPMFGESYSQFVYKIHIQRILLTSSLKTFLPVFFFVLIAMISLIVGVEKLDSRVGMNTAMLIASVMFHLAITNQLPPAAYLTIADKVLVATYAVIGLNLLLSVLMMRLVQMNRGDDAKTLRERSFRIVPGFALAAYLMTAFI